MSLSVTQNKKHYNNLSLRVIWNIESECEGFNIGDVEDIEFVDAISLGNTTVPLGDTEIKHLENLGTRPFQISCSNTNTTITGQFS